MEIVVRPAVPEEAGVLARFQVAMAAETEGLELDPETVRAGVQAVFDEPSRGAYWVAACGEEVVGGLLTIPEWSDWRNGTVLWIHSVYVVPAARRRGVYRRLYAHLERMVTERDDLMGLRLYVDRRNESACRTYRELGMDDQHYLLFEWLKPR